MSFSLDDFVAKAREAASQERAVAAINDLMTRTFASPATLTAAIEPFERDDEPLFEDEQVSIYWVRFDPHVKVPPHNHKIAAFLGVYEGIEVNELYRQTDAGIELVKTKRMGPGDTLSIGAEGIHGVYSEGDSPSIGLHVYLGALSSVERELSRIMRKVARKVVSEGKEFSAQLTEENVSDYLGIPLPNVKYHVHTSKKLHGSKVGNARCPIISTGR